MYISTGDKPSVRSPTNEGPKLGTCLIALHLCLSCNKDALGRISTGRAFLRGGQDPVWGMGRNKIREKRESLQRYTPRIPTWRILARTKPPERSRLGYGRRETGRLG